MTSESVSLADAAGGPSWDAIVIGAGPSGALVARELALSGKRVLLADRGSFPRPKVCGACLNGQAIEVLRSTGLGHLPEQLGGISLDAFHLGYSNRSARLPLPAGVAVSRSRLDAALSESAVEAGARLLPETLAAVAEARPGQSFRRVNLSRRGEEASLETRVVLVASGLGTSCLAADRRFRTHVSEATRVGAGCRVEEFPEFYRPGTIFMAVARSGYVGLTRVEDGSLNVAAAFDKPFLARRGSPKGASAAILDEAGFPAIPRLADVPWKGTLGLTRRTRPIAGERLFLIGDACGYVEPFTGEGMGWALMSARAVVPLVLRGIEHWEPTLAREWGTIHRGQIGRKQQLCRGLASLLRHPWIMRGAFEIAAHLPSVARPIIGRVNGPPHTSPIRPYLT